MTVLFYVALQREGYGPILLSEVRFLILPSTQVAMDTTVEEALVQRELVAAMSQTASTEETGSQSSGVQMPAVGSASGDVLGGAIEKLRRARAELAADRKRVNKELKNAEKRRRRLKIRAQNLSTDDLVAVMQMRAAQRKPARTKKSNEEEIDGFEPRALVQDHDEDNRTDVPPAGTNGEQD